MALQDTAYKSVGIIVGVALLAAIVLVISALGSRKKPEISTKSAYRDEISGLVFEVPLDWTFGRDKNNKVQLSSGLISQIQVQKSDCSNFSPEISRAVKAAMEISSKEATGAWLKQYPGLEEARLYNSSGDKRVLVGIDICNPTFTTKKIMLRGQVYTENTEVKLTTDLSQKQEASSSELEDVAKNLARGNATSGQTDYDQFVQVILSAR